MRVYGAMKVEWSKEEVYSVEISPNPIGGKCTW
jgi:hypothetical protein